MVNNAALEIEARKKLRASIIKLIKLSQESEEIGMTQASVKVVSEDLEALLKLLKKI